MKALLTDSLPLMAGAPNGIKKLRELILELAMRGKLLPQRAEDEPAGKLIARIAAEKKMLAEKGVIKKPKKLAAVGIDEIPYDIPDGWAWERLGTVGTIFNGNSISATEKEAKFTGVDGLPYIATKDVGYGLDPLDYENGIRIPDSEPNFKIAHTGAILICAEGGSAGKKCGITEKDICFGNKLFATEPYGSIPSRLILYYYLTPSFRRAFEHVMTGIIGGVSIAKFVELPIPLPPLAEQYRIVAKVDELMALCDSLEAQQTDAESAHTQLVQALINSVTQASDVAEFATNWRRVAEHVHTLFTTETSIETLQQAILQLAVMGKLVTQDISETSSSLQSLGTKASKLIDEEPVPYSVPPTWHWMSLVDLLEEGRDISYGVIKLGAEPKQGGVPTLRCSDVKPGYIDLRGVRKVSHDIEQDYSRTRLRGGEILINIRGTLGGVAVADKNLAGYNVAREVAVVPLNTAISAQYVSIAMQSSYFWQRINQQLRGIAYKGLNLGALRKFPIPIPPVAEQYRIVAKVCQLMSLCDQLKTRICKAQELNEQLADTLVEQAVDFQEAKESASTLFTELAVCANPASEDLAHTRL